MRTAFTALQSVRAHRPGQKVTDATLTQFTDSPTDAGVPRRPSVGVFRIRAYRATDTTTAGGTR